MGITRAPAASILTCLALLCVPAVSAAAEPSASPTEAQGTARALVALGAGYGQPDGAQHVRTLQRRLGELGLRPGPIDGYYGPLTKAAVERLQRDSGLSVDGIVGPETRRVLEAESPPLVPGAGYAQPGGSQQVRVAQRLLRELGHRPGPIDGEYGPRTQAAVERFQRSAGQRASGVLASRTAVALAGADRDKASRTTRDTEPPSDSGQQSREPAGEVNPSDADGTRRQTAGPKPAETDAGESPSAALLLALALGLATIGGVLSRWLRGSRPSLGEPRTAGGPVTPPSRPNGAMTAAKASPPSRPPKRPGKAAPMKSAPSVKPAARSRSSKRAGNAAPAVKPPPAVKPSAAAAARPPAATGPAVKPPPAANGRRRSRSARSDAAAVKQRIRNMRASGMTLQAIADRLNAEDVPTLRGGATWRPSGVQAAAGQRRAAAAPTSRAKAATAHPAAAAPAPGGPPPRAVRSTKKEGVRSAEPGADRRAPANGASGDKPGMRARSETWLPATSASSGAARSIVRTAAAESGLEGESAWDLMMAATEAVNNAVQHGRAWPNGCILLATEPCDRGLRVEVADRGTFDSALEPAPLDATSGRGLQIIAALVDRLEVRNGDGQTLVRFEKHRSPASSQPGGRFQRATHEPAPRDRPTAAVAEGGG